MRIRAAKTSWIFAVVCGVALSGIAFAQENAPVAPDTKADTAKAPDGATKDGAQEGKSPTSSALDYLFNRKPQQGTAAKEVMDANQVAKSRAIAQEALGGGRIEDAQMRARFEKYLSMTEMSQEQLKAYSADMDKVLQLLRDRKEFEAWKQLYKLASYESIDAGVSWELANRIESIWNADRTNTQINKQNDQLRQNIERSNRSADMMSDDIRRQEMEYQRKMREGGNKPARNQNNGGVPQVNVNNQGGDNGGGGMSAPDVSTVMGKLQLTEEYLNSLESKARIKMNELKAQKLFDKAKADFAEYISTLYQSGRHRHVLIASDFWRRIFDEGEYPVSMAQQVNASLEINREVQSNVDVFETNLKENDIAVATDRLQEAFMTSEFHSALLGLPRADKKKVEAFTKRLGRMQNMIEARDFTSLEELLTDMKKVAPDFDTTKPMAIVNAVKLESQLRLGKAKIAAQQGDLKQAMEEFQAAAEAWPGNPDLKDKALTFFNSQDLQTQSLTEFDRLVADNNYRAIFDKQLMFAPAMKDDKKRQEQLKDALGKVKIAEMAVEKANLMRANGDVFGAWETVEVAIKELPSDLKLNTLRGDLAGKGAEFVAAINKAKDAEDKKELGYSLTWYAIAQRYYPASQIANQAIDRISKQLLTQSM